MTVEQVRHWTTFLQETTWPGFGQPKPSPGGHEPNVSSGPTVSDVHQQPDRSARSTTQREEQGRVRRSRGYPTRRGADDELAWRCWV